MRLIDADALAWVLKQHSKTYHKVIALDVVLDAVRCSPTIDAVSVVRCKECKHAHMTQGGECKYCDMWKDDDDFCLELYLDGDFYCADGERKESE